MKNILQKIKSIFKHKTIIERPDIDPHKHWVRLLGVFALTIIALIIFSFYVLYEIKNDTFTKDGSITPEDKVLLKEELLKEVLDLQSKKALKEKQIRTEPTIYKDPSF